MQITVKPQDRTEPETLELRLHPEIVSRLKAYAQSLNDSDVSYVAGEIFTQVLPALKFPKKLSAPGNQQAPESAGKTKTARTVDPAKKGHEVAA